MEFAPMYKTRAIAWMESSLVYIGLIASLYCWQHGQQVSENMLFVVYMVGTVAVQVLRSCGHVHAHAWVKFQFIAGCSIAPHYLALSGDAAFTHRSLGVYAIVYRFLVPYMFHRQPMFVGAVSIFLLINECRCTRVAFQASGYEMPPRIYGTLSILTLFSAFFGRALHLEWKTLCDTQEALAEEKAAQEALISMLCDSCVLIGVDGDTITRGTRHLDTMLGRQVRETKLSDYLPQGVWERNRVVEAFGRAQKYPVNLPVTLLSQGAEHRLDMFIVRRSTKLLGAAQNEDLGFLVGFRFVGDNMDTTSTIVNAPTGAPLNLHSVANSASNRQHLVRQPLEWNLRSSSSVSEDIDCPKSAPEEGPGADSPQTLPMRVQFEPGSDIWKSVDSGSHDYHFVRQVWDELDPKAKSPTSQPFSCDPRHGMVWSDSCALPKPLCKVTRGERILCYDNIAHTLGYTSVLSISTNGEASSDILTITMADGSTLRIKADQLVRVQALDNETKPSQQMRTCTRAEDLEAGKSSLMVVRTMPVLVSSVTRHSAVASSEMWFPKFCVAQPERYEPLITSYDTNNQASRAIAISSSDLPFQDRMIVTEKRTFLSYEEDRSVDCHSVKSAPARVCIVNRAGSLPVSTKGEQCYDWEEAVLVEKGCSVSEDCESSSSASSASDRSALTVTVGNAVEFHNCSGFRLSNMLDLKKKGIASIGSMHSQGECTPCEFYNSTKNYCRGSFMCQFCHDPMHFKQTTRSSRRLMRKTRSVKSVGGNSN